MHMCGDTLILEILHHYHNMENYITIINILIILHISVIYEMMHDPWIFVTYCWFRCVNMQDPPPKYTHNIIDNVRQQ